MKIGKKQHEENRLVRLTWVVLLLVVFAVGIILGQNNIVQSAQNLLSDADQVFDFGDGDGRLPTLPFARYNDTILRQRDEAIETGIYFGPEEDFANADIQWDGEQIPVRLRLRQGQAAHLGEDEKWNLEIRTRDGRLLSGMQRFYLIDPADNNWLNEWALMESLRREGLLAPRYSFVNLVFNGDDWGIYALQEGFGAELISSQDRQPGVVVEFDAQRLWESVRYFEGEAEAAVQDPVTNLQAYDFQQFEVDTFRDAAITDDPVLSAQKDTAIGLLRGLQNGELAAADVFDVEQYGRFLALIDLWGGTDATSLVNLRYYYNPENGRLEPIAFNANPLSGDGRISLEATYGDPALQLAYSQAADQFSQPAYLEELQAALDAEWQTWQTAVRSEHQSQSPWETLAQRQTLLRLSLAPLQPVFAYLGDPSLSMEAIIQVDVANILNLPVEILGFDIDGATFLEADPNWLQDSSQAPLLPDAGPMVLRAYNTELDRLQFVRFHLPLTEIVRLDTELDFLQEPQILVATRILGQERPSFTAARPGYPNPVLAFSPEE